MDILYVFLLHTCIYSVWVLVRVQRVCACMRRGNRLFVVFYMVSSQKSVSTERIFVLLHFQTYAAFTYIYIVSID